MGRLETSLCGIKLDNPVTAASGAFGYGHEFNEFFDINRLGTFSFKGTTLEPRSGNLLPRVAEAPSGMINSVGLENPGADKVINEELPRLFTFFRKPVIANICGFSVDEYARLAEKFDGIDGIGWIEVNISCPNVHGGCMSFGCDASLAASVTRSVRHATSKPVIVKLTPNVTDICGIAAACESEGADAISLINTVTAMRIDIRSGKPLLKNQTGGLSGPAIFPIALRMVWQTARTVRIPIVGIGGISSAEDVIEMMMAGASAVGIGASLLTDPFLPVRIIDELPAVMDSLGISNIKDIIGIAL